MQPKIYHATDHDIDPSLIDPDAVYIVKKLKDAGFLAYLVGGSVRDLLVKIKPKDYDISTSALPEQIKQLFQRQCLLIGKRFRLAHVRFGHKIFEVSTFRSGENDSDLIIHDNAWGTAEEDAIRRDFTINALYYDPQTHEVIDYVEGWKDIHRRVLRVIGEPLIRFKQDPVRMIRLLKFHARFAFSIEPVTWQALMRCHGEIVKSAPARILEEILRMLESGAAASFFKLMAENDLLEVLFPCLTFFLKGEFGEEVYRYLEVADQLNNHAMKWPLDRSILASCLLYPILDREIHSQYLQHRKLPNFGEILMITSSVVKGVVASSFAHFPKRLNMMTSFILSTQYRMTPLSNRHQQRHRLFHMKEFDLALRFLQIRSLVNPELAETYNQWYHQYKQERQSQRHEHHNPPPPEIIHH